MIYTEDNIFQKILKGEIPCKKVYEDPYVLAFHDIRPKASIHIVIIPKGQYVSFNDFTTQASDQEIVAFMRAVQKTAQDLSMVQEGYRLITNHGAHAHQEVPHFHMHLLGGEPLKGF